MNILYTTTFNDKLFNATGRGMITSFIHCRTEGDMLISHEGVELPKHRKFIEYDLSQDEFLNRWLKENEDIIPAALGGKFEGKFENKFRYRASQWFRKIPTLKKAMEYDYDAIVFVDSDVVFKFGIHKGNKVSLTSNYVSEVFGDNGVFCHYGKGRRAKNLGVECGFVGFHMTNGGREFLEIVIDIFDSGKFREYERWDDSYIFGEVIKSHPEIKVNDLVENELECDVVERGIFDSFITHDKGVHWREHGFESPS
tara:strand:+ start:973 stop:1737 length:765 start_codon:yes stop_codon:yes gene_type:complete